MSKIVKVLFFISIISSSLFAVSSFAAGGYADIDKQKWSFAGIFGKYDKHTLQRGFQVYMEVCAACHSLKYVAYRDLAALGYNEAQIKAVAANFEVSDGPNDEGEYFTRPARPSDRFVPPFPNDEAARYVNNGALPPDLSLAAKFIPEGPDFLYAFLTSYRDEAPAGEVVPDGLYWNDAAHLAIAMPQPLYEGTVEYQDGHEASIENMAYDVSNFLMWAAEPHLETRKKIGFKVMMFLIFFTIILYANKVKLWRKVH